MNHATKRAAERLQQLGIADVVLRRCQKVLSLCPTGSIAVRVHVLEKHHGDITPQDVNDRASNGDEVWCVVRDGTLCTVMFRRAQQPKWCDRFGTAKVGILTNDSIDVVHSL